MILHYSSMNRLRRRVIKTGIVSFHMQAMVATAVYTHFPFINKSDLSGEAIAF